MFNSVQPNSKWLARGTGSLRNSPHHPRAVLRLCASGGSRGPWVGGSISPSPLLKSLSSCCGAAPPRMAALVVSRPGTGLDSGRQGSRGTAVVKVRDLACCVFHRWPPFGSSRRSDCSAAALDSGARMRGLWAPRLYEPCPPVRDWTFVKRRL